MVTKQFKYPDRQYSNMELDEIGKRFDFLGALYLFCVSYHSGQWSRGYRILSRLSRIYKPGLSIQCNRFENLEQYGYYLNLVRKFKNSI